MRALFAFPGDLAARTGGYIYDAQIIARAGRHGVDFAPLSLPASFPAPDAADLARTADLFRAAPERVAVVDGLAYGAFTPDLLRAIPQRIVALVHHPLALESGLSPQRAAALRASERRALERAQHIVAPSATTRDDLVSGYGAPPGKISIAPPGACAAPRAPATGDPPHLLAVGSLVPRKGYDILLAALAQVDDLPWRLTIVGSPERAPDHAASLRAQAERFGARIVFAGEVADDALAAHYAASDLFVLASHHEGYGMVLAEAMARGLPIVTTRAGAAAQTAPDAAAVKVPPGDADALAAALRALLRDPARRAALAEASFRAGQDLPSWDDAARRIADVVRRVAEGVE